MSDEPTAESPPPAPPAPPASSPAVSIAPGWYSVDPQTNAQAYWDGEHWAKTRHWRGTGWVEDAPETVAAGAGAGAFAEPGSLGAYRLKPPSPRYQSPSQFPPSMPQQAYQYRPPPAMARPMAQTTNGSAVASLVLSLAGFFGIGSLLGIIFGYKARREIRASGGYQGGHGLALAGIIIGYITGALFLLTLLFWFVVFAAVHNGPLAATSAQQNGIQECQADVRSVEVAVTAYDAQKGTNPTPPVPWSATTYASDYAPLTSGADGGPYLHVPPETTDYVIEYDSSGHVWVAPPGTFEPTFDLEQGFNTNPNACAEAVPG